MTTAETEPEKGADLSRLDVDEIAVDLVIIGAGAAGAVLFKEAAVLGHGTLLLEKNLTLGDGPSTRNEGWAHRSYHAIAIEDEQAASMVARAVAFGHRYFREGG